MTNAASTLVLDSQIRTRMIEAAQRLLDDSPANDISARAVCQAVGVGRPVLNRLFGDKSGLLSAVVDDGYHRYIERKRSIERTTDPMADLHACWDDHLAFAAANPALCRLMFSPALRAVPDAAGRIFVLLTETLDRCAVAGTLRIPSNEAAQTILSANIGVAMSILSQPDRFSDPRLSDRVRDAVFATCLTLDTHRAEDHTDARD